jgi:hypothetical protein
MKSRRTRWAGCIASVRGGEQKMRTKFCVETSRKMKNKIKIDISEICYESVNLLGLLRKLF